VSYSPRRQSRCSAHNISAAACVTSLSRVISWASLHICHMPPKSKATNICSQQRIEVLATNLKDAASRDFYKTQPTLKEGQGRSIVLADLGTELPRALKAIGAISLPSLSSDNSRLWFGNAILCSMHTT
jgi:hypothetical protein